ncbi:MAG: hypothetical protein KKC42_05020, partial [Candidatus Omnitrophica bacterium]|nr:hypothetical protein [Candidatus Omnitrophota bacterium]
GNFGMAMLFERFLLEQKARVQQPPKCERSLALMVRLRSPLTLSKVEVLRNRPEREKPTGSFVMSNNYSTRKTRPKRPAERETGWFASNTI